MAFPKIGKILFHNNRVYFWIVFCNLYGLYWLLFRHPYIFNGMSFGTSFDPLSGYKPFRIELFNQDLLLFTIHNTMLAIGSPILYLFFSICVFFKGRELINNVSKEEKMVFIQVFTVSMLNTTAGLAYAYNMHNSDHGIFTLMIAHFSWLHIHGFPPVIYLILNKTVRNDTKALFKKIFSSLKKVKDSSVGSNNQQNIRNNTWM